jgi:hypothetical protein
MSIPRHRYPGGSKGRSGDPCPYSYTEDGVACKPQRESGKVVLRPLGQGCYRSSASRPAINASS